jgi:choline dehydrogenase-like flavoprotein
MTQAPRRPATNMPDVCVVGAGGTGAVIAKELAEAGLGVVVLETGPWHDPQREFSGLEWDMLNPFDSVFRWGPLDRSLPPWPRARDGIGLLFQTPGVGGNTLHYGANCPRAYVDAVDHGWPLRYSELVPYYERVEETLPVVVPDTPGRKDALFIRGCEASGIEHLPGPDVRTSGWRMQPNAILPVARAADIAVAGSDPSVRYPAVDGCVQCGECIVGCRNPEGAPLERTAKRSTAVSYAPLALRTKRCEFRTGCFVTAILTEERDGRTHARAVRYRDAQGRTMEQDARVVVLAAGAIETPRLWLASKLPRRPAVGRFFTTHWFDYVSGVMPFEVDMYEGQTSMARAEFPGYGFVESQGLGPLNFALATSFGPRATRGDGPWAAAGRTWGSALKRRMENYRRTLMLAVCVDDDELPESRIALSPDLADENNPAPHVRYRASAATVRKRDWLARRAAEIVIAAGADPASVHRADAPPSTIHMHGTMRMGNDPERSVVDAACEAHDVSRLFVADTSVFPNGIGGPNPTLTAQANATRVAQKILERHFA